MKRLLSTLALLLAVSTRTAIFATVPTPEPSTLKWTIDGIERRALVFTPAGMAGDGKMPLVFAFHGHGQDMQKAASSMGISALWPEALVVYMQGVRTFSRRVDPLALRTGWQLAPGDYGDRDLKFFDAVLATLRAKYPVDPSRIYAAGFSNGGYFSYLLWAERASTFAAFASCAGSVGPKIHLTAPKPILQIAGEKDWVVPFKDQEQTIATVRAVNSASGPGEACGAGCTLYVSAQGAPVEAILHPGRHVYPPWVSVKIVEFLKMHRLAP